MTTAVRKRFWEMSLKASAKRLIELELPTRVVCWLNKADNTQKLVPAWHSWLRRYGITGRTFESRSGGRPAEVEAGSNVLRNRKIRHWGKPTAGSKPLCDRYITNGEVNRRTEGVRVMKRRSTGTTLLVALGLLLLFGGIALAAMLATMGEGAQAAALLEDDGQPAVASAVAPNTQTMQERIAQVQATRAKYVTSDERQAAAARRQEAIDRGNAAAVAVGVLDQPDFFGSANWAFSPQLAKFVDTLPGLNAPNTLGNYIPIAVPDTITYPGSRLLRDLRGPVHSEVPPRSGAHHSARLRADQQRHRPGSATTPSRRRRSCIWGPQIITKKDRPVRIKFTNALPLNEAGNLFVPVDRTVMGSGYGPLGADAPTPNKNYSDNRAVIHLHGGHTPWISDGTPHQWITPAGREHFVPEGRERAERARHARLRAQAPRPTTTPTSRARVCSSTTITPGASRASTCTWAKPPAI